MKLKLSLALVVALCLLTLAFKGKEKEKIKVQVVHHQGNDVLVYDTIFEKNSNYTVQNFLTDKGLNPETTDIIDLDKSQATASNDVWVLKDMDFNFETGIRIRSIDTNEEVDLKDGDEIKVKTVKVIKMADEDGNIVTQKFVDGEEVSVDDETEELPAIKMSIDSIMKDLEIEVDEDGKQHRMIKINGVQVEDGASDVIWKDSVKGKMVVHKMNVRMMETDDEKEGDAPKVFIINKEVEHKTDGTEGAHDLDIIAPEGVVFSPSFTVAMVSTVPAEKKGRKTRKEDLNLAIDNLNFFPKPNDGRFTLAFDLAQQGDTELLILDMSGRQVYSEKLQNFTGHYENKIDISEQPSGTYVLSITQNGKRLADKVIIH